MNALNVIEQYRKMKASHPDVVLMFRENDYYVMYEEDAEWSKEVLGLAVLKQRGMKKSFFPYHRLDTYLPKTVRAGRRVAICDQLETEYRKELATQRHCMRRKDIQSLYKMLDEFVADCTPEEVFANKDAIIGVQTLLHQREQESK